MLYSLCNIFSAYARSNITLECEQSFSRLKHILTSDLVLAYPKVRKPYKTYINACDLDVCAIVVQEEETGIE